LPGAGNATYTEPAASPSPGPQTSPSAAKATAAARRRRRSAAGGEAGPLLAGADAEAGAGVETSPASAPDLAAPASPFAAAAAALPPLTPPPPPPRESALALLWRTCLRDARVWMLAAMYFFVYIIRQAATSWLIFYLTEELGVKARPPPRVAAVLQGSKRASHRPVLARSLAQPQQDVRHASWRVAGVEIFGLLGSLASGAASDALVRRMPSAGVVGVRMMVSGHATARPCPAPLSATGTRAARALLRPSRRQPSLALPLVGSVAAGEGRVPTPKPRPGPFTLLSRAARPSV
jgi:hypothetical protein